MLKRLEIDNFLLIDRMRLNFDEGSFCCITGESGSGKTMILKALDALWTGKIPHDGFFDPGRNMRLCAVFSSNGLSQEAMSLMREQSIEPESFEVIFERTVSLSKSHAFVQGARKPQAVFARLFSLFISLNRQRDESRMAEKGYAMRYLDGFCRTLGLSAHLRQRRASLQDAKHRLESDRKALRQSVEDKEYLEYAVSQIDRAEIAPDEDEAIRLRLHALRQKDAIAESVRSAIVSLSEGPYHISGLLRSAVSDFKAASRKDESALPLFERAQELLFQTDELIGDVRSYFDSLNAADEDSQKALLERQDLLSRLKKAYGSGSLQNVLRFREDAAQRLERLSGDNERISELSKRVESLEKEIVEEQKVLDNKRAQGILKAEKAIESVLHELSMEDARFRISFERSVSAHADSAAEFFIAVNKGKRESLLRDVASGGELSRIFLAMISIANDDGPDCEIFDEIDAGLGGQAAARLAGCLKNLSERKQVIAVTHQALVASECDCHIKVSKRVIGGRTVVEAQRLGVGEERKDELQRMMIGDSKAFSASLL